MRPQNYQKSHCWQYEIRLKNLEDDLQRAKLTKEEAELLTIRDFTFDYVPKDDKEKCNEIKEFITRHEWLGKMPSRPTHRFTARYKGILAGVIVMATPNAFSNLLGKENRNLEKLISRGACISWSPKNLGSSLVMYGVRWMVKNTEFRYFTAYSDTTAKELGTIYQACNFIYLGKRSGARAEYFDPENPSRGWFTDRLFRRVGQYKNYAIKHGIEWKNKWSNRHCMNWNRVPSRVEKKLRQESKDYQARCQKRKLNRKHKYVYILGNNKKETQRLKKVFLKNNERFSICERSNRLIHRVYPKLRGN